MATQTVSKWTPFGVALDITATSGTVTRTSATAFTVKITASWETYYSGAQTNYGMTATSGGVTSTLNAFGTKASSGSKTFTGSYTISGNSSASKTITVAFKNFNTDNGDSATKNINLTVTVPAWTWYKVAYDGNGGSGAPSSQIKWKDQALTLSTTKPTRTGYTFLGWSTSSTATTATYTAGATLAASVNYNLTLYAVWKAITYTVLYKANGGTGAPASQTKTYGVTLTLSSTIPTRTNYNFLGWATSASATTPTYSAGGSYTSNSSVTLYAVWELAYRQPRISSVTVTRCDINGVVVDSGEYAMVAFDWETDYTTTSIKVQWKVSGEDEWTNSYETNPSESDSTITCGSFMSEAGQFPVSSESTYIFRVTVSDGSGSTIKTVTLASTVFTIDIKSTGDGVAFGKSAELENVLDIAFQTRMFGGILHPVLEAGTDLNEVLTPNTYVGANVTTYNYENCPITSGTFTLEVTSAGDEGQLRQRIQICHKTSSMTYERYYYQSEWGDWYEAGDRKSAITIGLSDNSTLGAVNTYTTIPFNASITSIGGGLTLSDNGVKVGTGVRHVRISGQTKITCGTTAGNRHARLCKNSGGTISYISWLTVKMAASSQEVLVFTPAIVSVTEGDILYMVFYTPDATDYQVSGSSSNGRQTYITVESI